MVPPSIRTRAAVRPEIQALRAIAVCAVVLHHGWPAVAPAGYMGVDVFFVVSGFLITALLLRESARTGRISLRDFYLRRARRILPAAMAVLVAVTVLTYLVVPRVEWRSYFREVIASALYFENWLLAADSQDPARDDLASTPVQHFWSLSVEEQFYLAWPLLIIAAIAFAARRSQDPRRALLVVLGAATIASFAWNVVLTVQDHNLAYFSTFTRVWEFGVGGILAILVPEVAPGRARLRAAVGWLGLALIAVPILLFRSPEVFPGVVVLVPVAGALAVIWSGMPAVGWSPARVTGTSAVQWTGDISYSLYLWHWPIFMFAPFITGVPSPSWLMVLLVIAAFAVAAASKRWIEDPGRFGAAGARRPRSALLLGSVATLAALVVAAGIVGPSAAGAEACEPPARTGE
ncbi:acyltransferase family protein [Agromyces kandeliae]|uniref:Acyltransferase family protein n=1 Tax=Agromyces kandeliae TaxID=2666141 RepID=A0A6L5R5D0_9MICO|nr:acyltransferase [Agromyces kandeliae]MRX44317.1 acyltransferase family protein [Agromyces kandeliae]